MNMHSAATETITSHLTATMAWDDHQSELLLREIDAWQNHQDLKRSRWHNWRHLWDVVNAAEKAAVETQVEIG